MTAPSLPEPSLAGRIAAALLDLPASLFALAIEAATLAAVALVGAALYLTVEAIR